MVSLAGSSNQIDNMPSVTRAAEMRFIVCWDQKRNVSFLCPFSTAREIASRVDRMTNTSTINPMVRSSLRPFSELKPTSRIPKKIHNRLLPHEPIVFSRLYHRGQLCVEGLMSAGRFYKFRLECLVLAVRQNHIDVVSGDRFDPCLTEL